MQKVQKRQSLRKVLCRAFALFNIRLAYYVPLGAMLDFMFAIEVAYGFLQSLSSSRRRAFREARAMILSPTGAAPSDARCSRMRSARGSLSARCGVPAW